MEFMDVLNMILPVVYILVGCVLVWFVIELVLTIRVARKTVTDVRGQLQPTLDNVEKITDDLQPTIKHVEKITAQVIPLIDQVQPIVGKVDPLVDRVSLTVDAANLEIMRVDQILEDVTQITGSVTKTMDTVDTVTSAPLELVNSVTSKMRSRFKPRYASEESVALGQQEDETSHPVRDFVDAASDAVETGVAEQRASLRERKAARAATRRAAHERTESLDGAANGVAAAVVDAANADTADVAPTPTAPEPQEAPASSVDSSRYTTIPSQPRHGAGDSSAQ